MYNFIKSSSGIENWYHHDKKEVCFIGRSNVGKSSLINAITKQKLARTSNTPGRTQLINFFGNSKGYVLVDLPGYGYARMPNHVKDEMMVMIEQYFASRRQLSAIYLLVDIKVGPTKDDLVVLDFLKNTKVKIIVIGTKADKANQSLTHKTTQKIKDITDDYIFTSVLKGKNIDKVRASIKNNL